MERSLKEIIDKFNFIYDNIKLFTNTFGNIDYKEKHHLVFLKFLHNLSDDIFHVWDVTHNPSTASIVITLNLCEFYPDQYTARISFLKNRKIELKPDDNSKYQFKKISGDYQEIQRLIKKLLVQFRHPELRKDEFYYCDIDKFKKIHNNECKIFNSTDHVSSNYKSIKYKTKREGENSYHAATGEEIGHLYPVFISKDEFVGIY